MDYPALRILHVTLAALSVTGFVLRCAWAWRGTSISTHRLTRVLPHVLDTLFLATGVSLALWLSLNPLDQPWLMAKLIGLVAYIVLGALALRRAPTPGWRITAFVAALLCYTWIASVALLKSAWGVLALLA